MILLVVLVLYVLLLIPVTTSFTYFKISKQTKLPIKFIKKLIKVSGEDVKCRICGNIIYYPSFHLLSIKGYVSGYMSHLKYIDMPHPKLQLCCRLKNK